MDSDPGGYLVTTDPACIDVAQVHALLRQTHWSPNIRREVVEVALRNSLVVVAIESATGATVGVARVVTDYATFAWLCDVFVSPPHRARGLSKRMIRAVEADPRLGTLRRWCLATRDAHGLYEQFGYGPVRPGAWMEKKPPTTNWQEPGPDPSAEH
jgi:GNAT superfamily N-acetyltransferase